MLKQLIIVTTNGLNRVGEKIEKYSKLSEAMFAIVEKIEKRNQIFEERIEKSDKNIESLLILVNCKK